MNVETILDTLYSLQRFGIKPGLERTQYLLQQVGNPERSLKCIHVAGTNGKGSVCSFLASVLIEQGYKTGLYTSPHIQRFHERIRINGLMIDDEQLLEYAAELMPHIDAIGATFFEATTVMALMHFARSAVDCAVIETGLGGRFDSTNVITPLVSVISSIDLDHQEYLGTSLEQIAAEKAGIIKAGVPVIVGEPRRELRDVFLQKAALLSKEAYITPVYFLDDHARCSRVQYERDLSMSVDVHSRFAVLENLSLPLAGEHQARNLLMVLEALTEVRRYLPVSEKALREGVTSVRHNSGLRGRMEILRADIPLVLDVGHNPACVRQLVQTLRLCGYEQTRWNVVFGVMADKEYREMLRILAPITHTLFACAPDNVRAVAAAVLEQVAKEEGINTVLCANVAAALTRCLKIGAPTLVLGSFYVAEEAMAVLTSTATL